jgi:CDP-paratose 2-epimerase
MKVLVTGGCGFVGSHVVERYAQDKKNRVIAFDNLSRGKLLGKQRTFDFNRDYLRQFPNVRVVSGDIRKSNDLASAMNGAQLVIHTAAQTAVTTSVADPVTDFEVNAVGTFNVLETARRQRKLPTVVVCSTNKVYGENVNQVPLIEQDTRYEFARKFRRGIAEDFGVDLCEHSPYGCSKLTGDLYAQDYARLYGMKIGVFRMSCIYGPRQFGMEDQGWLAWFTIAALRGQTITIYGDGKQMRDVLYVTDLVAAYEAFHRSSLSHGVFNMGGGSANTISLLELVDLLRELTGKKVNLRFDQPRPSDQKVYVSDIRQAQRRLKWRPVIVPAVGIRRLFEWLREHLQAV